MMRLVYPLLLGFLTGWSEKAWTFEFGRKNLKAEWIVLNEKPYFFIFIHHEFDISC